MILIIGSERGLLDNHEQSFKEFKESSKLINRGTQGKEKDESSFTKEIKQPQRS